MRQRDRHGADRRAPIDEDEDASAHAVHDPTAESITPENRMLGRYRQARLERNHLTELLRRHPLHPNKG